MNYLGLFYDAAPLGGGIGVVAGVVFLLVCLAAAFLAFRLLKKSVKMAFRLILVGIILLIAIVGTISLWWLGSSRPARPERPRPTQTK